MIGHWPVRLSNKALLRQYLVTLTATISTFTCGNLHAWPSPTLPKLLSPDSHIKVNPTQISWMVSLVYLGIATSTIPSGYLMDRIGRKRTLLCLNFLPLTSWLLILCAQNVEYLYVARFLAGVWLGTASTIIPIYLSEIGDAKIRGKLSAYYSIVGSLGSLFMYSVGPYVSFRALAAICCVFPVCFCFMFMWMPESPYFLLKQKQFDRAKLALTFLRDEVNVDEELRLIESSLQQHSKEKLSELISARKAIFIILSMSFLQKTCGTQVMIAYLTSTLPKKTFGLLGPSECLIISGCIWTLTLVLMSFFIDRLGRKFLLIFSSFACGTCSVIIGAWWYMKLKTDINVHYFNYVPFIGSILHVTLFQFGMGSTVATLKSELLPPNIKGIVSGVITILAAIFSFGINRSYQIVNDHFGIFTNYWMYAVSAYSACLFTITFIFETKGKSLTEIQDILTNRTPPTQSKAKRLTHTESWIAQENTYNKLRY